MDRTMAATTRVARGGRATAPVPDKAPELLSEAQLSAIRSYNALDERTVLMQVEELVRGASSAAPANRRALAGQLASLLGASTSYDGNHFLCRQLALIGEEDDAAAIAALLRDPKTCDMARYALEAIPGEKVDAALLSTLAVDDALSKIGIVNSLGNRCAKSAARALEALVQDADRGIADAARVALAKIAQGH